MTYENSNSTSNSSGRKFLDNSKDVVIVNRRVPAGTRTLRITSGSLAPIDHARRFIRRLLSRLFVDYFSILSQINCASSDTSVVSNYIANYCRDRRILQYDFPDCRNHLVRCLLRCCSYRSVVRDLHYRFRNPSRSSNPVCRSRFHSHSNRRAARVVVKIELRFEVVNRYRSIIIFSS